MKYGLLPAICFAALFAAQSVAGQNITLTITSGQPSCFGSADGSITAVPSGGVEPYFYEWGNGQSNQSINTIPAGTYAVTVTDQNGQTAAASYALGQPDPLEAVATVNAAVCGGNNGTASIQAAGGRPPYHYIWTSLGNVDSPVQNNLAAGTYPVLVVDAGNCQKPLEVVVPSVGSLNVTIAATKAQCPGVNNGTATAIVSPSGYYHFAWNIQPNNSAPMITGVPANTLVVVTVTDPVTGCTGTASAVIGTHEQVKLTVTDVDILCLGDTLGSANAQAYLGTAPYHYVWYSNQDSIGAGPSITGLEVGAYGVVVTDDHGCTAAGVADITAQSGPVADFEFQQLECVGDSVLVQLVDHSFDTYSNLVQWSWQIQPDNGGQTINLIGQNPVKVLLPDGQTGTISLTVTSAAGCTAHKTSAYKATGVPNFQVSLGGPLFTCDNQPVPIHVTGDSSYTYVWSTLPGLDLTNAPFHVVADPDESTTYSLTVSNGLCDTVIVFEVLRTKPIEALAAPDSTVTCSPVLSLTATAAATAQATFAWFNGAGVQVGTGPVLNILTAGTNSYAVVATDKYGCTDSDTVSVTGNAVDIQINTEQNGNACAPKEPVHIVVTGNPSYTYQWTADPTLDLSGAPFSIWANPDSTTTYTLYVNNGICDSTYKVTVERAVPIDLTVESNNVSTCLPVDTLRAFASANAQVTFEWFENGVSVGSGPEYAVQTNGTHIYTVVATDAHGCTDSETITVTVQSVAVAVQLSQNNDLCNPQPVQITVTGNPAYTYQWTPDATLNLSGAPFQVIANPMVTTVYTLHVSNGVCDSIYKIKVERTDPINLSVESNNVHACAATYTIHTTVGTTANVTYEWFENGVKISDGPTLEVSTDGTHTYTVVATGANGCTDSEEITVTGSGVNIKADPTLTYEDCEQTPVPACVINLNPTDILTYHWESGVSSVTIVPDNTPCVYVTGPQGVYVVTVTATNQYGCSDTVQIPVTFLQSTSLDGKILVDLCNGLRVKFFNNSGIPGTWTFGDNSTDTVANPVHVYGGPGQYHVFFTPEHVNFPCIERFDTIINVLTSPPVMAEFVDTLKACELDGLVQFTDKSNFVNPIATWDWTFSNGASSSVQNPAVTFDGGGLYDAQLIVTDINGCADTVAHSIQVDTVAESLTENMTICPGESVELNPQFVSGYTYVWSSSPLDPNFDPTMPNPVVSPADTTVYSVAVTNGVCTVSYQVTVNPIPPVNVDLMAVDTVLCSEDPITILITNNNVTNITWYDQPGLTTVIGSGSTFTLDPVKDVTLYVTAETILGKCPALDSIKIDNQTVKLEIGDYDQIICQGASTQLNVIGPTGQQLTYNWSPSLPGVANPTVFPLVNTTYTVTVTNQNQCTSTAEFTVDVLETISVKAEILGPDTLFPGETATLLATVTGGSGSVISYQWIPSTWLTDPYSAQTESHPEDSITYIVIAQTDGRCPDTAQVHIEYRSDDCKEPYIFVPKAFTPNGDSNNDFFIVRGANITELEFIVWDRWGEIVYRTTDLNAQGWDGTQNGKELTPDAYAWYCRVKCGSGAEYISKGDVTLLK